MKVKFLQAIASIHGGFSVGEEYDLPDGVANEYVGAGYAERVDKAPSKRRQAPKEAEGEE